MKIIRNFSILSVAILFLVSSCHPSQETLFQENGQDWESLGNTNWIFSDGKLTAYVENKECYALTKKTYMNFILEVEFKPDSTINSGVFVRCKNKDINPTNCYELNIWDLHPEQNNRTGAIVTRAVPKVVVNTIDKWNTYKIKINDSHIQVWINVTLTVDKMDNSLSEGYIGLQAKGTGKVEFRNVKIKNL